MGGANLQHDLITEDIYLEGAQSLHKPENDHDLSLARDAGVPFLFTHLRQCIPLPDVIFTTTEPAYNLVSMQKRHHGSPVPGPRGRHAKLPQELRTIQYKPNLASVPQPTTEMVWSVSVALGRPRPLGPRGVVASPLTTRKRLTQNLGWHRKSKKNCEAFVCSSQHFGTLTILFHPQVVHIDLQKPYAGQFLEIFEALRVIHISSISPKYKITWHGSLPCLSTFPTQLNHPLPHEPVSRKSKKLGSDDASGVVQDVVGIHIAGNGPPIENLLHHGILALNGASAMQLDHFRIFGSPLKMAPMTNTLYQQLHLGPRPRFSFKHKFNLHHFGGIYTIVHIYGNHIHLNIRTFKYTSMYYRRLSPGRFFVARRVI